MGLKEVFNHAHSSLRNVIERSFGVLKMKWPILLNLPSYPVNKQSKIIVACIAFHSFIKECDLEDSHFQEDVEDDSPHLIYDNTDDGVLEMMSILMLPLWFRDLVVSIIYVLVV